jgi:hypothetical protein
MDFEVYCDESGQELFKNHPQGEYYSLIGSIWIKAEDRRKHKDNILAIRKRHNVYGEFKWNRVSNSRLDFYLEIIKWFFESNIRFRTLVLRADELDAVRFHCNDNELMFYKFYYQLLHHWILDFNCYKVFLDTRTNRLHSRLKVLEKCLNSSNLTSSVVVQALPSNELDLIQIADVLIGAVSYKFHRRESNQAKLQIIREIEQNLGQEIKPTSKSMEKFNVFRFRSEGGW